jgi:hypothetical protein
MGQQSSTQIDEVEEASWKQLKEDIIDFVKRKGIILNVSRIDWTEEQKKTDREERRDELVNRFAKFTDKDEKLSLIHELEKTSKNSDIIIKLKEKMGTLKF